MCGWKVGRAPERDRWAEPRIDRGRPNRLNGMNTVAQAGWEYRVGGIAAVFAAFSSLSIAAAFALTGLGAAGDKSYGSFSGLTFIPQVALVVTAVGLYRAFSGRIGRGSRLGLLLVVLGLTLSTTGHLGGAWLGFARSGNVFIVPGTALMMAGLITFSVGTREAGIPTRYRTLALSLGLLPMVFLPVAAGIETLRGDRFPPSLHDNYFRTQSAFASILWLVLGLTMLRDGRQHRTGSA